MRRNRGGHGRTARPSGVPRHRALHGAASLGAPAGLLLGGLLAFQPGNAAFTASSASGGHNMGTASVSVALDHGSSPAAMFSLTGAQPGQRARRCVRATYTGSVAAGVRVFGSGTATAALDPHLDLLVEQGTGGTFTDCAAFTATSTAYSGTLADFRANRTSFATGVGTWAPAVNGDAQTYRVTVTVNKDVPASAAGRTSTVTFAWEARNT